MNKDFASTASRCVCGAPPRRRGWRNVSVGALIAVVAFFIGNSSPPLRTWLSGLKDSPPPQREPARNNTKNDKWLPVDGSSAKALAANWNNLRDATQEELRVAERILTVMRSNGLHDADVRAQEEKVHDLRNRLEHCEVRLRELVESDPPTRKPVSKVVNPEELDIQHRQVMDQRHLKKIGPGQQPE